MLDRVVKFLTSLRLTVVFLGLAVALVFFGTLAQVDDGLYMAQARWFRSFFVWWGPQGTHWKIPIFPGGYLIGSVLLVNLVAAQIKRFKFTWKKFGIYLLHAGVILLLLGQLATDLLSRESQMRFTEGQKLNYSESPRKPELVFLTDSTKAAEDKVVAIPDAILKEPGEIRNENLPFTVKVKAYYPNSMVRMRGPVVDAGKPPAAANGAGADAMVFSEPESKDMDTPNFPSAVVELAGAQGSLGTWLVSTSKEFSLGMQEITIGDKTWRMGLRWERYYLPYSVQLLSKSQQTYPGMPDLPRDFRSRVRIENPSRGENREVTIYMNNPLRYEGQTFYQYQMGGDEFAMNRDISALQVVKNPSWLTPYAACVMVFVGMSYQFLLHLVGFISKRRIA